MADKIFAFVINGEIFYTMRIPEEVAFEPIIAGMRSSPEVIEVTQFEDVAPSWRIIDGILYRPAVDLHYHYDEGPGYEVDE